MAEHKGLRRLEALLDSDAGMWICTIGGIAACVWIYVHFFSG